MGNGRRTILFTREGAVYPSADEIDVTLSRGCRILLVDPVPGDAAVHAAARARAAGIAVVADVENVAPPASQFLLQKADHLIIGWEAGRRATGLESPAEIAAP
jgi:sugar/nucleoside kinase (ribokinase family)